MHAPRSICCSDTVDKSTDLLSASMKQLKRLSSKTATVGNGIAVSATLSLNQQHSYDRDYHSTVD